MHDFTVHWQYERYFKRDFLSPVVNNIKKFEEVQTLNLADKQGKMLFTPDHCRQ